MAPPLLTLRDIHLTFGGEPLLEGVDLSISENDRICLVGRNGSGKSTILKIAAGLVEADDGEIFVQPGATIRYLPQEPNISGFKTTLEYAKAGLEKNNNTYSASDLLTQLGLRGDEILKNLSGGELRRTALVHALVAKPDILLLDEPTNHLDVQAIEWLEDELNSTRAAIVLISHDRRFLENLSKTTIWLSLGKTRRLKKGFENFETWRDEILEKEKLDRHKLGQKIIREQKWLRYGVTARRKRNVRRLNNLRKLRDRRRHQRIDGEIVKMVANKSEYSSKLVLEAKNISKSYDGCSIVKDFSIRILRGDRVGFVGKNGVGKTTLLRLLIGEIFPDKGKVRSSANINMVSLDQHREDLNKNISLSDALTGGNNELVFVGDKTRHVVSYMKDFLFKPEQRGTPVSALSGGERGRLMLARALSKPSNLLVLDEPTNDLDLETLDLLQELLADYAGTVLLVSHDRDFLDRIVTSTVVPSEEALGTWTEYSGGYSDMLSQRNKSSNKLKKNTEKVTAIKSERKSKISRRMSFKEKHELESLPKIMDSLRAEIDSSQEKLSQPDYYSKNPTEFERIAKDLSFTKIKLEEIEGRWLELELKKEKIEGD